MNDHLFDFGYSGMATPIVGRVLAVHAKHTAQNDEAITLYDVEIYPRGGIGALTLPPCPFAPNASGGAVETEDPLTKDEWVLVDFIEEDPDRPFILSRYCNLDQESEVSQTEAEAPHYRKRINGVKLSVAKDGTADLTLPANKTLTLRNEAGDALLRVLENGDIELGQASLKALVTEDFISGLANALNLTPVAAGDGGLTLKMALFAALTLPSHALFFGAAKTTKVKGQ